MRLTMQPTPDRLQILELPVQSVVRFLLLVVLGSNLLHGQAIQDRQDHIVGASSHSSQHKDRTARLLTTASIDRQAHLSAECLHLQEDNVAQTGEVEAHKALQDI